MINTEKMVGKFSSSVFSYADYVQPKIQAYFDKGILPAHRSERIWEAAEGIIATAAAAVAQGDAPNTDALYPMIDSWLKCIPATEVIQVAAEQGEVRNSTFNAAMELLVQGDKVVGGNLRLPETSVTPEGFVVFAWNGSNADPEDNLVVTVNDMGVYQIVNTMGGIVKEVELESDNPFGFLLMAAMFQPYTEGEPLERGGCGIPGCGCSSLVTAGETIN